MPRFKYLVTVVFVLMLIVVAISKLSLEMNGGMDTVFSISWLLFALLVTVANWRRLSIVNQFRSYHAESIRRKKWLEAQRQLRHLGQQHRQKRRAILPQ